MRYGLINTVTPAQVIKFAEFFDDDGNPVAPDELAPEKGLKWLPDSSPSYVPLLQTRTLVSPMPVDAEEILYEIADRPIAEVKADLWRALNEQFDARGKLLTADYSESEQKTWPEQTAAAEAYVQDPEGDHAYLEAMLLPDEEVADLAQTILTNRNYYLQGSAALIKHRREVGALIDALTDETREDALLIDVSSGWPA